MTKPSIYYFQEFNDVSMEEENTSEGESEGTRHSEASDFDGVNEENEDTENVGCDFGPEKAIDGPNDIAKVNLCQVSLEDLMKFHFPNVGVAFMFYNWYASTKGFAGRKDRVVKNFGGEIIQQTFVCYREGHRVEKSKNYIRKRKSKPVSRCGCTARCQVHVETKSGRWYIKYFNDVHNHSFVDKIFTGMLPAHRKMSEYDKYQMSIMRNVGMKTRHIYGLFAHQARGYENVGYLRQDMYNEQYRQRRTNFSDAKRTLDFLSELSSKDDMFFWRHTVDEDGFLEHLFWCYGVGRKDWSVFGDVLAFGATYKKNKYLCPVVVFSRVNHHNQSIVFVAPFVANETKSTYVWLLQQLIEAMGGKSPLSVITDGDLAM